jgi:hypothetical protein
MKTQRLVRNEDGSYSGSVGASMELDARTTRKIRETLAQGPVHISEIARRVDVSATEPVKFNALCRFVEVHLGGHTREAEMAFAPDRKGRQMFQGWQLTEHGKKLLEVS